MTASDIEPDAAPPAAETGFARHWAQLTSGLSSLQASLRDELEDAWRGLAALIDDQVRAAADAPASAHGLADYSDARTALGQSLLIEPLSRWERTRPLKRAQFAIEGYRRGVDDLIRRLATSVELTGDDLLETLGPEAASGLAGRIAGWRREPRRLPFEAVVASALREAEIRQAAIR